MLFRSNALAVVRAAVRLKIFADQRRAERLSVEGDVDEPLIGKQS